MEGYNHKQLTVLMTTDTIGGVWTYCMELCKALQPYNIQFHLATLGAPMQQWQVDEVNCLANVVVHMSTYKLEWMHEPWEDVDISSRWLLELERKLQPDIIHLNSFCYGSLSFKAPKVIVAHSDVYSWWHAVKDTEVPDDWNEFYRRVKNGLDNADIILAPSNTMMQSVLKNYKTLNRKKIIYNSREIFISPKQKQPVVLSVGRIWDEAKNIQLLTKAAPSIKWLVKIAGEREFMNNTTEVKCSNVEYLGKCASSEVINEMERASIYVLPAKYEPFGLSILEAALCGCALVLGDIPSLKEIWSDAALYVDTNNAEALASAVNRIITDADLREYYQTKAKERAMRYNIATFATQYYKTYTSLIPRHKIQPLKEEILS